MRGMTEIRKKVEDLKWGAGFKGWVAKGMKDTGKWHHDLFI